MLIAASRRSVFHRDARRELSRKALFQRDVLANEKRRRPAKIILCHDARLLATRKYLRRHHIIA